MPSSLMGNHPLDAPPGFSVVIPARYGSTRLPAKALADIAGMPMVCRVAKAAEASGARRVIVACDDQRILDACEAHGVVAELTSTEHPSGSDRVLEVVRREGLGSQEIVVNLQGDEPSMPSGAIRFLAERFSDREVSVATLVQHIETDSEFDNPNHVKVVVNSRNEAIYFSRSRIPYPRNPRPPGLRLWRHIGIYAFRVAALEDFVSLPPGAMEQTEALEQLRLIENGRKVHAYETPEPIPRGVDTPEDLEAARSRFVR